MPFTPLKARARLFEDLDLTFEGQLRVVAITSGVEEVHLVFVATGLERTRSNEIFPASHNGNRLHDRAVHHEVGANF